MQQIGCLDIFLLLWRFSVLGEPSKTTCKTCLTGIKNISFCYKMCQHWHNCGKHCVNKQHFINNLLKVIYF